MSGQTRKDIIDVFTGVPVVGGQVSVNIGTNSNVVQDNLSLTISFINVTTPPILPDGAFYFGGSFSGTTDLVRRNWSKARTPTVFRTAATAAVGNTAVWTPGAGNKFRVLRFRVTVTGNATLAVAGVLTVTFLDAAGATNLTESIFVPAAAVAGGGNDYDSGWIDLGFFGVLSALANNVLNVNLSAALTAGVVNVLVAGTEE